MGLKSWLKNEVLPGKRRSSAPPTPVMSAENYDPNANREQYLQAFDDFIQRGNKYKQLTIKEENEENGSESTGQDTNEATDENGAASINHQANPQSKPGKKPKRHSLPNKMSHQKTNTPNTSVISDSENNNTIFVNDVLSFEENCVNDCSFGAAGESPPQKFYRNNSNPFPDAMNNPDSAKTKSTQKNSKIEEARQRACGILRLIRPNSKKEPTSSSSGAYKRYDLNSSLSNDVDRSLKQSNGQDIPVDMYAEIVNIFEDVAQRNVSKDQGKRQTVKENSPVKSPVKTPAKSLVKSPVKTPVRSKNESGMSGVSAFASFRQCQGMIDENFGFLNDAQWNSYLGEENEYVTEDKRRNVQVTDLDNSVDPGAGPSNYCGKSGPEQEKDDTSSELDSLEEYSRNVDLSVVSLSAVDLSTVSTEASKKPIHIIECKAKDIKAKTSSLRNTIVTPLDYSSGSFRRTTVTLKKCCPRDSPSIRLVEEAIERDYEILSKVKHPNIVILMAACFHRKLINHMTLVLEPVDYTLNYLIHQMNDTFTVLEAIAVTQQIASATLYLQECGYIHSNISSHNILVRQRPWIVKLSSFELATDIDCADIRAEVEINCPHSRLCFDDCTEAQSSTDSDEKDVLIQEPYMKMSKRPPSSQRPPDTRHNFMSTPTKYLIYDTSYRQCLSLHNYVAPELMTSDERFVFPTTKTDVYSLCLLLWEMLNKCIPYVAYSKIDLERMVATSKLKVPFFRRERCQPFFPIFSVGLAANPEVRPDVHQLIEMLENTELEILTVRKENFYESKHLEAVDSKLSHTYENVPERLYEQTANDPVVSSIVDEPQPVNTKNGNSSGCVIDNLVLSPSLLDFDKSLTENERTSTRKLRKKPQRKCLKQQFSELVASNDSHDVGATADKEKSSFVDLNEKFSEEDYDILDVTCDDEKLNDNLSNLAESIRYNVLDDTEKVGSQPKIVHKPLAKETEFLLKMPIEQRKQAFKQIDATNRRQEFTPTVVGFSVKANRLNNSKTSGNLLETPVPTSGVTRKLFNSKKKPSPIGFRFDSQDYTLPDTPIARQNYIRRNAWLSQQSSSNNEYVEKRNENDIDAIPLNDDKKVNVSVRIVHNKVTPKKVDGGRPSILSKINFFNSATETTAKPGNSTLYDKCTITPVKVDDISPNNISGNEAASMLNEPITELATKKYESGVRTGTFSNGKTSMIEELKDSITNLENNRLDQPQQTHLFENKLWKRELDICNRSFTSNDGENDSKVVTPKWRSVRDTIMKFEKREQQSSTQTTPTDLVKILPKTNTTQQHPRKLNDSSTLIKRTIYSESILSGVERSPVDNQLPHQISNFDQKVATRVSLRQFRQRSSDVSLLGGPIDVRHTICGSELKLLTFNANPLNNSIGSGPSCPVIKYVCFNCASRMSSEELKALRYEPLHDRDNSALEESPIRRCQVRVNTQNTRSIEDLYIDDDFVHGLGAMAPNMELQSECSALLDFDLFSSEFFNSKHDAAENNIGN